MLAKEWDRLQLIIEHRSGTVRDVAGPVAHMAMVPRAPVANGTHPPHRSDLRRACSRVSLAVVPRPKESHSLPWSWGWAGLLMCCRLGQPLARHAELVSLRSPRCCAQ